MTLHLERPNPRARRWPMMRRDVAILLWASFLAACVATMFFFAMFDPLLLAHDDAPPRWLSDRMTGYTCGFFFFWFIGATASFLTAFLIDARADGRDEV
ncbi:hypothetical protein HNQ60_000982 [Povalibacter uvarum]|uniref:Uncharacterized protein n=1 Tax=Povalibacter uvarum TaxID=732238 RepID=A0A841HH88_9GAMM|nr:hypothetical protein [Povalibacter uvarum]MBB6092136.1 hypothetical protein [Povalibacter uvarum]